MKRKQLAWIVLPAGIVILAVATFVISSYQKEVGLGAPGKGGRVAVAALAEARSAGAAGGASGYELFSQALSVAAVSARNMPVSNPAEMRLNIAVANTLDCLHASREAWQAQLEQTWDPDVDGSPQYWQILHSALTAPPAGPLSPEQVRTWSRAAAGYWLQKAVDLTD